MTDFDQQLRDQVADAVFYGIMHPKASKEDRPFVESQVALFKQLFLDLIGEDEADLDTESSMGALLEMAHINTRNDLRAELRKKIGGDNE